MGFVPDRTTRADTARRRPGGLSSTGGKGPDSERLGPTDHSTGSPGSVPDDRTHGSSGYWAHLFTLRPVGLAHTR